MGSAHRYAPDPMNTPSSLLARVAALFSLALGATNSAIGAPDSHRCASITPDAERLACYDKAFGSPSTPSNGAATPHDFGLPASKPDREASAAKKEETITAVITSVDRRRDGKLVVTLDNAQTWAQSENNSQVDLRVGDTITVRRGALGSYLLISRAGVGTRVKRVR